MAAVTAKIGSQHCCMCPGGEGGLPLLDTHVTTPMLVTQRNAVPFYQTILLACQESSPKGGGDQWYYNCAFWLWNSAHVFSYLHISKVPENGVNRSLQGSLCLAMWTRMEGWGKEHFS